MIRTLLVMTLIALGGCAGDVDPCPTAVVECGCPGGARGAQFCQPDGTFGRCECPGADAARGDEPGPAGVLGEGSGPAEGDSGPRPGADGRAAAPRD